MYGTEDDPVVEEIQRVCNALGVEETDVEDASRTLYGTYLVKRPRRKMAVACVGIAMQEFNNDIPLDFIVTASSVDDTAEVRRLKTHIEDVLDLTYQSDVTED
jgi:transcription initiation factor TFIIIB Brf1 subunit/transcription initiation factor TFIIB